ncbi:hypothetical protein [Microbispora sp. NPDC049125]|uniref:hypothetical protein n=1 Tax=Microbispora sp. NPDC049125 TaxID=3154929 RepID=UPI003467E86F
MIAPRVSWRRRLAVIVSIVAVMALLAVAAWWSGAAVPWLSATPTLVEPGAVAGRVRLHVDLRNEGLVPATPSSISPGTTLPVRVVDPHDGMPDGLLVLPRGGWTLPAGGARPLVLELDVPCGSEPGEWRLEMVAYGRESGYEVRVAWKDGPLPGWRRAVADMARAGCP